MVQSRPPSRQQTNSSSGDGRPPTTRHGGIRTPRRVQWASRDDVRLSIDPEALSQSSKHALDELGLDPEVFETLRGALERHRSETVSANDRVVHGTHPFRPQSSVSLTQPLPSRPALPQQSSAMSETCPNFRGDRDPFSTPPPSHSFSLSSSTDVDRPLIVESPSTETGIRPFLTLPY
ncbi:hypothetical protein EDC04DRAFT_539997 [Pisolithus marmoratus]|nr:hypothetical protein EDC04DRAFT_539997 [Pisolithus marmoratus]